MLLVVQPGQAVHAYIHDLDTIGAPAGWVAHEVTMEGYSHVTVTLHRRDTEVWVR